MEAQNRDHPYLSEYRMPILFGLAACLAKVRHFIGARFARGRRQIAAKIPRC
jgi:hypothetical protein